MISNGLISGICIRLESLFHSCGCSGPGYIPGTVKAIIDYLEKVRSEYMKSLVFWRYRIEPENKKERELDYQKNSSHLWAVNRNAFKETVTNQGRN